MPVSFSVRILSDCVIDNNIVPYILMYIKVCIANHGTAQLWCLEKMLDNFRKFTKYRLDVTEYTTESPDRPHYRYEPGVGHELPFRCRFHMASDINKYDLFVYSENDHLITEKNIDAFVGHQAMLPPGFVSGFIRYEFRNGEGILLDPNPAFGRVIDNNYGAYFSLVNNHQGCWLLTRDQLAHCIDSGEFLHKGGRGPYGGLEQGATDPYNRCGLKKVLPTDIEQLKNHLILHMPIKYSVMPQWLSHGINISNLNALLSLDVRS